VGHRLELLRELAEYVKEDPTRVRTLVRTAGAKARYFLRPPDRGSWTKGSNGWDRREYGSYEDYISHQSSKLATVDLEQYDTQFHAALLERLEGQDWRGTRVLCLAARIGTEVRAFIDVGAFAVGIDLNPGIGNRYVVVGDFHDVQYADGSVDAVYINSLDHSLRPEKLLSEVRRVLVPGGRLIVEAPAGGEKFDEWAVTGWPSIDDLSGAVAAQGFAEDGRMPIREPWDGFQLTFTCDKADPVTQ
jgi:SAM-dependent methyltransferase